MSQELLNLITDTLPDIELEKNVCVYLHINSEAQDIFYVGIGVKNRPYATGESRGKEWNEYVKSIYFNYEVIILYDGLDYVEASEIEIKLIAQIGRKDKGIGNLLNKTDGGGWSEKYAKLNKVRKQRFAQKQLLKLTAFEEAEKEIISNAVKNYKNQNEFRLKNPNDYHIAVRFSFLNKIPFKSVVRRKINLYEKRKNKFEFDVDILEKVNNFIKEYEEISGSKFDENN